MTSRERVLNLIAGKAVDRPPAMPITMMWAADLIGAKYHSYATRAQIQAAGQAAAAGQFGFDYVSVISDPACEAADLGADIFYPPDGPPAIIEEKALLADLATLGKLRVPDPRRGSGRTAIVQSGMRKKSGSHGLDQTSNFGDDEHLSLVINWSFVLRHSSFPHP